MRFDKSLWSWWGLGGLTQVGSATDRWLCPDTTLFLYHEVLFIRPTSSSVLTDSLVCRSLPLDVPTPSHLIRSQFKYLRFLKNRLQTLHSYIRWVTPPSSRAHGVAGSPTHQTPFGGVSMHQKGVSVYHYSLFTDKKLLLKCRATVLNGPVGL